MAAIEKKTPSVGDAGRGDGQSNERSGNPPSTRLPGQAFCATSGCAHANYEEFISPSGRRIVAICPECDSIATRAWYEPVIGLSMGWLWPDQAAAHRAWKQRLCGGRS